MYSVHKVNAGFNQNVIQISVNYIYLSSVAYNLAPLSLAIISIMSCSRLLPIEKKCNVL